jgi:hypothetical protein
MHRLNGRLRRLEAQKDKEDNPDGPGLAALLAWARRRPEAEDDAFNDDDGKDDAPTGLTALLAEARRWLAQRDQDTPR